MDEEQLNIQIRKFLKKVGINSQREIEQAVREAAEAGSLIDGQLLAVKMTLEVPAVGVTLEINDTISIG
ncbi:MAG: DUF6494 family protein [Arenicellales bacterium WSBS_2016_MAG_OTU3]